MSTFERELVEKISRLSDEQQRKVLQFVQELETPQTVTPTYSARDLMKLPLEQRERIIAEVFALAASEDFETFEAYSEENFDESP